MLAFEVARSALQSSELLLVMRKQRVETRLFSPLPIDRLAPAEQGFLALMAQRPGLAQQRRELLRLAS